MTNLFYRPVYAAAVAIVAVASSRLPAASLPDTIDQVRASIVAVGSYQATRRPPGAFRGTGFVIDDGQYIVTNFHVLPEVVDFANRESIAIFSGRGKKVKAVKADVVAKDAVHDLAILRIRGQNLPALPLGGTKTIREGDEIAFTGFPIGMVLGLHPVTHRGIVAAVSPVVIPQAGSKGLTAKAIRAMRDPYDVLQLDATAYPGNSGSPVYDQATGRVVGVINSVLVKSTKESALESPTGITYAIPVKFVKALLRDAKSGAAQR